MAFSYFLGAICYANTNENAVHALFLAEGSTLSLLSMFSQPKSNPLSAQLCGD